MLSQSTASSGAHTPISHCFSCGAAVFGGDPEPSADHPHGAGHYEA